MKSAHHSPVGRALPALVFRIALRRSGGQCPPYGTVGVVALGVLRQLAARRAAPVPRVVATRSV
jgi:hypothetical protein